MKAIIIFIYKRPFLSLCIVAGIIVLLFFKGCVCNSSSVGQQVKVYKDSIASLKKKLDQSDRDYIEVVDKYTSEALYYSQRSDSFERLRDEDLKLLATQKVRIVPLIQRVKSDSSSTKECDSLADEFQRFIWATGREQQAADSLIANKEYQLSLLDSLWREANDAYARCRDYFKISTELFGLTYQAYTQVKPRNTVSVVGGAQYFPGSKTYAVLLGFDFMNKKKKSLTLLGLIDKGGNYGAQLQTKIPIKLRK